MAEFREYVVEGRLIRELAEEYYGATRLVPDLQSCQQRLAGGSQMSLDTVVGKFRAFVERTNAWRLRLHNLIHQVCDLMALTDLSLF